MNYAVPILATLMVCFLPSVLGIVCNMCTPDQASLKLCSAPAQLTEVNCDNLNVTVPGLSNVTIKFDTCITAKIVATFSANQVSTYVMECAVKDNSSDPSMINCTSAEASICTQATGRVQNDSSIQINSCNAKCCDSTKCNDVALIDPPGSTTAPTTRGGANQVQPPLLGFLLVILATVFLLELAEYGFYQ